jgi:hypothetical protein
MTRRRTIRISDADPTLQGVSMTDTRPDAPVWYVRDADLIVLSTVIRERRAARRLAYTFDPGLALAEEIEQFRAIDFAHDQERI